MRKPNLAKLTGQSSAPVAPVISDPDLYRRIGLRIAQARESMRLTQEQLGALVGESSITISRWENATRKPNVEDVLKLAKAVNQDVLFFVELEPPEDNSVKLLNRAVGEMSREDREELLAIADLKRKRYLEQKMRHVPE